MRIKCSVKKEYLYSFKHPPKYLLVTKDVHSGTGWLYHPYQVTDINSISNGTKRTRMSPDELRMS